MSSLRIRCLMLALTVLTAVAITACGSPSGGSGNTPDGHGQPRAEIEVRLGAAPTFGEPFDVIARVTVVNAVDGPVEAWFELPPSVAFINGDTHWKGELEEGESHVLRATLAVVAEGASVINARVEYPDPIRVTGIFEDIDGVSFYADENRSELNPDYVPDAPSYWPSEFSISDYQSLVNEETHPRLLVIRDKESFHDLRQSGALGDYAEGYQRLVLDRDAVEIGEEAIALVLYDRRRPSTGYHLAILRIWGGIHALQMVGESVVKPGPERPIIVLDMIATEPRDDWPVDEGAVSPVQVEMLGNGYFGPDGTLDLVLLVNGEQIGRHTVSRSNTEPIREILLADVQPKPVRDQLNGGRPDQVVTPARSPGSANRPG